MASKKVNGLTIAINADTKGVTEGLKDITSESVKLSNNLKAVDSLLKLDPGNTELLAERQKLLAQNVETTSKKLQMLKDAQEDVSRAFKNGEISDAQYIAFQKEIVNTQKRLDDMTRSENEATDASDDLEKSIKDTGDSAQKASDGFSAAAVAVGTFIGNLSLDILKSAVSALKDLGVEIVKSYGELEQSLGGSEAVFGEYASEIQKAGEDAYKNLGISQADYLASANKMGALFQGSGFTAQESLNLTVAAMQRAADAASVMGIDASAAMESVAGAAKGNFTMMDNLGVSINDTTLKAYAMEKGLGELETTQDKVSAAFQLFLEKTEQYDGNFANEATETVSGSFGLLEASVTSLVAGLGNSSANIEKLTQNVTDSIVSVIDNIVPVIETALASSESVLNGISDAIEKNMDTIINVGVEILMQILTGITKALPSVAQTALSVVNQLVQNILKMLPDILKAGVDVIVQLINGISLMLPNLIPLAVEVVTQLVTGLANSIPQLIAAAMMLIQGLDEGILAAIPVLLEALPPVIDALVNGLLSSLPTIIQTGVRIFTALVEALPEIIDTIVTVLPQIMTSIISAIMANLPQIMDAGFDLLTALVDNLPGIIAQVVTAIPLIVAALWQAVSGMFPQMADYGMQLFSQLIERGMEIRQKIAELIPQIIISIADAFMDKYNDLHTMGINIFDNVAQGIQSVISNAWSWGSDLISNFVNGITENISKVISAATNIGQTIKDYIGFSEPDKGPLSDFHTFAPDMMQLFADGIKDNTDVVANQFNRSLSGMTADATMGLSAAGISASGASSAPMQLNVNVTVGSIASDYDVNRMTDHMIENISAELANLRSRQSALVGVM